MATNKDRLVEQMAQIYNDSAKEREAERKYNALSEAIIATQVWGQFYGIMRAGADLGEGLLKHEVCIAPDGSIVKVAKRKAGKWIQSFIRPAHEHFAKSAGKKKWGRALVGLAGFGWIPNMIEQKKAKCFGITPAEFFAVVEKQKKAGLDPTQNRPMKSRAEIEAEVRKAIEYENAQKKLVRNLQVGSIVMISGMAIIAGVGTYYLLKKK
jgi:hypothetical protein